MQHVGRNSNQAEASSSGNGIKSSLSSSTSSSFAVLSNAISSSVQVSTGDSSDGLLLGAPHSLQNLPPSSDAPQLVQNRELPLMPHSRSNRDIVLKRLEEDKRARIQLAR